MCQPPDTFPSSQTPAAQPPPPSPGLTWGPDLSMFPPTALLLPLLPHENLLPTGRSLLYPEQVLKAPADRQPVNRCGCMPGPLGRHPVCRWLWLHLVPSGFLSPIPTSEIPGELPQPPLDHVILPQLPCHGEVQGLAQAFYWGKQQVLRWGGGPRARGSPLSVCLPLQTEFLEVSQLSFIPDLGSKGL